MLKADEDALICDLAETYHIYDWHAYPVRFIATLACGLPEHSRIMLAMSGQKQPMNTQLLAVIADAARLLVWAKTKDAEHGRNIPPSLWSAIMGDESENESFGSAEEFEAARERIISE